MTYWETLKQALQTLQNSLKTTFSYMFGISPSLKTITEEYPDRLSARMPEDLPLRFRGFLNNDITKCSGCRYCSDVCPIDCIHIETEPGPERNISWVAVFDIDHSRCMFCGLCVDVCPTKSLTHTRNYEGSVFDIESLIHSYGKGFATKEMKHAWAQEQKQKEAMAEELALLQQSPVSAELRRRSRSEDST